MPSETQSTGRRIVRAMCVVIFFYAFWKFGGFLVNVFIGSIFPSGSESDAYLLAYNSVIFLLYGIVLKFFMPAFVPLFMEAMEKDGEESAWRFASGTINLLSIGLILVAALGMLFAPKIMWTVGQGFFRDANDPRAAMTISWVRIMFPGLVGMCVGVFTYGLLNSYKIFGYPAAGDACQKVLWALSLFALWALVGRNGVVIPIGFLVGVVVQLIINFAGLRSRLHLYRPVLRIVSLRRIAAEAAILAAFVLACLGAIYGVPGVRTNSKLLLLVLAVFATAHLLFFWVRARKKTSLMGRFAALATPLLIGILIAKARDVLTDNFTTEAELTGLFSDKKFAEKVGQLPSVVVGYALAIAMLPYLCEMAAKKSIEALGEVVDRSWRMIALFFIPLSIIMAVLAQGIMQLVYDRGNWPEEHLTYGGIALMFYISGLFFYAVENVLMYSFFSLQRTWTPTIAGLLSSVFHVGFLFACDHVLTLTGPGAGPDAMMKLFYVVIISFPLSRGVKIILLFALLRWGIPMLRVGPTIKFLARLAVLCVAVWFATAFSRKAMTRVVNPDRIKGRHVVVDLFADENAARNWQAGPQTKIRVENIRKPGEEPELALRIDGPVDVSRDLGAFDLSRTDVLTFKIKADREVTLGVHLTLDGREAKADVNVKASDKREKYSLRFDKFQFEGPKAANEFKGAALLRFSAGLADRQAGDVGAVWLDNVEFVKDLPLHKRAMFEIGKMVATGVPALVGLFILIAGALALRVEEMALIYGWLREQGLDKIRKRLKGKGGNAEGPTAPDS